LSGDLSRELGRMVDAAIHRIRVDIVGPRGFEPAIRVGVNRADGIAECATDVDVHVGVSDNQPRIVTAPCPDNFGDARRGRGGARENRRD
jgi:hypothetical protein